MSLISLPRNHATLTERLQDALAVTPSLITDIIHEPCHRFPSPAQATRSERVAQLIKIGAWTDAALALVELELPQWQIRRIAYDDGEWYCALSRERELPDWLDESIEGRHADLALAILSALVEAQRNSVSKQTSVPPAGRRENSPYEPVLCDNFA